MGKEEIAGAAVAAAETRAEMMESNHPDEETVVTSRVIDSDALLQTGWLGMTNGFGAGH